MHVTPLPECVAAVSEAATAEATKAARRERRKLKIETGRARLVEAFPHVFAGHGEPKRPLKIGIRQELQAALPDMPHRMLYDALRDYTRGQTYLRSLVPGTQRIDLKGRAAGAVTVEEANEAAKRLRSLEGFDAKRRRQSAVVAAEKPTLESRCSVTGEWPVDRQAMRDMVAIRARMAEDLAELYRDRGAGSGITDHDLIRLGWGGEQVATHGKGAARFAAELVQVAA